MSYAPLHLHSCYSIRDAAIKIDKLADKCVEYGIEACAITDHAFIGAAYKQYKEFKKKNIKPIIGMEVYFTDDIEEKEPHYHLVLLAKNNEGFTNLNRLSRISFTDGFYKKPRIDWASLEKFKDGLICSAACVFGLPQQLYLNNQVDEAIAVIKRFKKMFGEDYYLEIADHNLEDEFKIKDWFRNIGQELDIKVIPTTDSHYLNPDEKEFHNIFKQLAYNSVGKDNDGFDGKDYHVWSLAEMKAKFTDEEIANTLEVADKCNVKFDFSGYNLPEATLEDGLDKYEYLYKLSNEGMKRLGFDKDPVYIDRLEFEMTQIHLMDLEDYFLVVSDYIQWCRNNNIPTGPGRGSAAGCLVSYLIGITTIDPIKYGLMFARALNSGRALQYDFGV
jgi:DNA polymerase-3 subunit alpha